jgi:hypothetical protein
VLRVVGDVQAAAIGVACRILSGFVELDFLGQNSLVLSRLEIGLLGNLLVELP